MGIQSVTATAPTRTIASHGDQLRFKNTEHIDNNGFGSTVPTYTAKAYGLLGRKGVLFGSLQFEKNSQFSLAEEKKRRDELKPALDAAQKEFEKWQKKMNLVSTSGAGIFGAGGVVVDVMAHGLLMGGATGFGASLGLVMGSRLAEWLHSDNYNEAEQKLAQVKASFEEIDSRIKSAERQLELMGEWMDEALDKQEGYSFVDWAVLKEIRMSECKDVRDFLFEVFHPELIGLFPQFGVDYKSQIGNSEHLVTALDDYLVQMKDPKNIGQAVKAVRNFHKVESQYRDDGDKPRSREVYKQLLLSASKPQIIATALEEMAENPPLRMPDQEMLKYLEYRLASERSVTIVPSLLKLVEATDFPSSTVNFHLKRIENSLNNYPSQTSKLAGKVLQSRQEKGLYRVLSLDHAVESTSAAIIGNPELQGHLQQVFSLYQSAVDNPDHTQAAVGIRLNGAPGIGKTMLVHRLHETLHGTQQGLVTILLHRGTSLSSIVEQLKTAQPLQGKTVLFDEFHSIGELPRKEQASIVEFLKLLFSKQSSDSQLLKDDYGLDPKGAIVAVASNEPFTPKGIPFFSKNNTNRSMLDRIRGLKDIPLQEDLRPYIDDIIKAYGPHRLYSKEEPQLGENIQIADDAQAHLKKAIAYEIRDYGEDEAISGRMIVDVITRSLIEAIQLHSHRTGQDVPRSPKGHISQPLIFRMGKDGLYPDLATHRANENPRKQARKRNVQ